MKKKEYFIMVLMAILMILIVSMIIIVMTKKLSDEQTKEKNSEPVLNEEKNISTKLSALEQEKILEKMKIYDSYFINFDGKKDIRDLTEEEKITFVVQLPFEIQKELGLDFENGVSLETIVETLNYYFGKSIHFQPVNYPCFLGDGDYLIYNPKTKVYKADAMNHGHEGYIPNQVYSFYVDGHKEISEDTITYKVRVKKAFAKPTGSSFYGNYSDLKKKTNEIVDLFPLYGEKIYTNMEELLKIQYEKNKGLFDTYTYEFQTKKDARSAYLVKLER